jgi:hypothetical protein
LGDFGKIAVPRAVVNAERLKLVVPEVRKGRLSQEDEDVVEIVRSRIEASTLVDGSNSQNVYGFFTDQSLRVSRAVSLIGDVHSQRWLELRDLSEALGLR